MWADEVLEEVRAVREAQAARFGFDLKAIIDDLRTREPTSGHPVEQPPPPRGGATPSAANPPAHRTPADESVPGRAAV